MKRRLAYTFGNHMHWVDMQWLWGDDVLPGSIRDMAEIVERFEIRGGVNFDAVGYEKLAADRPEALQSLREMVHRDQIEVLGGSYGQPYGLFQSGESNCRQLIFGVRTCQNQLGIAPRTFWEEEFYFFPQLPQMLALAGFTGASLFFQWTWHTPEVPKEESPVIWWEGIDGTRILAATRNELNLHQWPEDMDLLLDEISEEVDDENFPPPLIQQWLELMPSRDWMCRAEVIGPGIEDLLDDDRFEIQPTTLGAYLDLWRLFAAEIPVRQYAVGDVWHGMTLGTSGDRFQRELNLCAESLVNLEYGFASASLKGRPYATWDVYPDWEIRECWRLLLAAQHHDCVECAGLCSRVALGMLSQVQSMAQSLNTRLISLVGRPSLHKHLPELPSRPDGSVNKLLDEFFEPHGFSARFVVGAEDAVVDIGQYFECQCYEEDSRVRFSLEPLPEAPKFEIPPGYQSSLRLRIHCPIVDIRVHLPYSSANGNVLMSGHRKYPEGDWMTSPQYFEEIENAYFSSGGLDVQIGDDKWLYVDASVISGFATNEGIDIVLLTNDPWQHDFPIGDHQEFAHHSLGMRIGEFETACARRAEISSSGPHGWKENSIAFQVNAQGTLVEAFYREHECHGRFTDNYAGVGMHMPFILRLVEYNGEADVVQVVFNSEIACAYKTNLLGQAIEELEIEDGRTINLQVKPHEIVTLYLDLVSGRKQYRDLDSKRDIWATVHRIEDSS